MTGEFARGEQHQVGAGGFERASARENRLSWKRFPLVLGMSGLLSPMPLPAVVKIALNFSVPLSVLYASTYLAERSTLIRRLLSA